MPDTKSAQNYLNIVSVLNDNTETNLTVEEIADMCNMSPSNLKNLQKIFRHRHNKILQRIKSGKSSETTERRIYSKGNCSYSWVYRPKLFQRGF